MLDFQIQQYPFRLGLAEGIEPHQAPPGTLITAENVCWKKSGKVEKRLGTTQLAATILGGGSITAASRLFTRGAELCLIDGTNLYSYLPSQPAWRLVDRVPNVALTWQSLAEPLNGVQAVDSSVSGDVVVTAWITGDPTTPGTGGEAWLQVSSASQGSLYYAPTILATGPFTAIRVLILGTTAVVLVGDSTTVNISAYPMDLTTFTRSGASFLRTDRVITSAQNWDAQVISGTTDFVLAYDNGDLRMERFTSALASVANNTVVVGSIQAISVDAVEGESVYVLLHDATASAIRCVVADPTTLVQSGATLTFLATAAASPVHVGICRSDATHAIGVCTFDDAAPDGYATTSTLVTSAATLVANTTRVTYGVRLASNPFMLGSRCYAYASVLPEYFYGNGPGTVLFTGVHSALLEMNVDVIATSVPPHPYIANHEAFLGSITSILAPLPRPRSASTTQVLTSIPVLGAVPNRQSHWLCGVRQVSAAIGASVPVDFWRCVSGSTESFFAAGFLASYDGAGVFDYGFPFPPVVLNLTTAAGAGAMAAGNYIYGGHLEYQGASALKYRGPTFALTSPLVVGALGTDTLKICSVNVSAKRWLGTQHYASQVAVYRSVVNGTALQRLTVNPGYNVLSVDLTASRQTLTDARADSSIDTISTPLSVRPAIYTTGGILDDYAPPANVTVLKHVDRLWVLAGDQRTWWYSKAFQDDLGTAPGFHPNLRISFDDVQTAAASMDDKAIFFSATGVRYMLGSGPAANGANSDFQAPTVIQSDVGCTSARSVVGTPDGVMFLSDRGLYLLTRGLELVWIGRPVKDTLAAYPTVTSAVLVAKQNQVRFTCTTADGTSGVTIVYDYVEKQWSTLKHWVDSVYGGPIADACMWNGAWTFVSAAGTVYYETTASYLDASGSFYVPMTLETSWINASGPLSFVSVRNFALQGISNTDHDLTISVGFDNTASYQQTATFLAESSVTTVGPLEECGVSINTRRKCGAIRFKIVDATPTTGTIGTGQGPSFDMMGLEVGIKRGFKSADANKRA